MFVVQSFGKTLFVVSGYSKKPFGPGKVVLDALRFLPRVSLGNYLPRTVCRSLPASVADELILLIKLNKVIFQMRLKEEKLDPPPSPPPLVLVPLL